MKIVSWNVNGLRAIYRKNFLDFLKNESPDLVLVQEVKAWPEQLQPEELAPLNYQSIFASAEKKGYSGVGIFYKSNLAVELISKSFGDPKFDQEGRMLYLKLRDLNIYNIYFPSGTTGELRQNFKEEFLEVVKNYFKKELNNPEKKIIIAGDFNICHQEIDIHHPKQATKLNLSGFLPQERKWFSEFLDLKFYDSFRLINGDIKGRYSWWTYRAGARDKNLGWRIDYIIVSNSLKENLQKADILSNYTGSDHAPIFIDLKD